MVCSPDIKNSSATVFVSFPHNGSTSVIPSGASCFSRYDRTSSRQISPKMKWEIPWFWKWETTWFIAVSYSCIEHVEGSSMTCKGRPMLSAWRCKSSIGMPCIDERRVSRLMVVKRDVTWYLSSCKMRYNANAESFPPLQLNIAGIFACIRQGLFQHKHNNYSRIDSPRNPK